MLGLVIGWKSISWVGSSGQKIARSGQVMALTVLCDCKNNATMFLLLSSWQSHCSLWQEADWQPSYISGWGFKVEVTTRSHAKNCSFDECRTVLVGPLHQANQLRPLVCMNSRYIHHRHLITTQPKSWYSFTVPWRIVGWVDLGGWLHTAMVYFLAGSQLLTGPG